MTIASGYTLALYCDCKECQEKPWTKRQAEYISDSAHCKTKCFKDAKRDGWRITKDGKCYAPKHKQPKTEQEEGAE